MCRNLGPVHSHLFLCEFIGSIGISKIVSNSFSPQVMEVNLFLGEIISHLTPNRAFEQHYSQMQTIVEKIVANTQDFDSLLTMVNRNALIQRFSHPIKLLTDIFSTLLQENFLPLIDLFHKESIKVDVCKTVIEGLGLQSGPITDPIVINALMFIARIMHDSVRFGFSNNNTVTWSLNSSRSIIKLFDLFTAHWLWMTRNDRLVIWYVDSFRGSIMAGILKSSWVFTPKPEQRSQILIPSTFNWFKWVWRLESPSSLSFSCNKSQASSFQCVNRLSVDTRKIVRGHHTRRTSAFVRACAAFCFITIPSLTLVHTRLQLYLLSGQVALLNQCLGQGMSPILWRNEQYQWGLYIHSRCLFQGCSQLGTRDAEGHWNRRKAKVFGTISTLLSVQLLINTTGRTGKSILTSLLVLRMSKRLDTESSYLMMW